MRLTRKQHIFNAVFCMALLIVIMWALYAEYDRPWKQYQKEFNKLEYNIAVKEYQKLLLERQDVIENGERTEELDKDLAILKQKLSNIPDRSEKIKQLWLQDFGVTDRCITCHQGADKPGFGNAPQPFKTHSGDYLERHPVEKYGCVICHGGQGPALTVYDAHGEVENWKEPLLKGRYAQSSCMNCHFIGPELPVSAGLSGASTFTEGWRLFRDYSCIGCHKLSGYERPEHISPSLTFVGSKVKRDWLVRWLKNPKDYSRKTKMPRFTLNDEEINYIADYLMSLQSSRSITGRGVLQYAPTTRPISFNKHDIKNGEKLVNSLGCLGCHMIGEKGNAFAPEFTDIGDKVKPEWLYEFLKKPKAYDPKTIIPDFMITENDIPGIAAYLMSLKSPPFNSPLVKGGYRGVESSLTKGESRGVDSPPDDRRISEPSELLPESIAKGKKLVKDLGCTGCHEIEKLSSGQNAPDLDGIGNKRVDELAFGNIADIKKTLINWMEIKVMNPGSFASDKIVTRMPDYGFSREQAESLVIFLLSLRKDSVPSKYTKTLIDPERAEMRGKKAFEKFNCLGCHKIDNEGGDTGPDLTEEAKKSRPEWLFSFLKRPHKIRAVPIMKTRMPDFSLSDEEINTITNYFAFLSGEPYPYYLETRKEIYPEDIRSGEKLYQEIFACNGCHTVNGLGGEVGPDHTDLASRLKRDWLERWLQDPQAIKPDVRMPRFEFEGWEFEALTDYLMTLGKYRFIRVKGEE